VKESKKEKERICENEREKVRLSKKKMLRKEIK
jgi:hypothetical protein